MMKKEKYVTYYHWAKRPPKPVPSQSGAAKIHGYQGREVVFLTKHPAAVFHEHGIRGNLYVIKVPKSVEKKNKPHWYDGAQELIVPKEDWKKCVFVGKASDKKVSQIKKAMTASKIEVDPKTSKKLPPRMDLTRNGPTDMSLLSYDQKVQLIRTRDKIYKEWTQANQK